MANQLYNGIKRSTDVILTDLNSATERTLVVPNCIFNSYNQGIDVEEVFASSPLGEDTLVDLFPTQHNPTIQVTFPKKTPETLGMKLGYKFEQQVEMDVKIARNGFLVESNIYSPADMGFEGYTVTQDATGVASYLDDNGISVPLTQTAVTGPGGFDTANSTLTFAVGQNGGLAFSDDLIGKYVTFSIDASFLNQGLCLTESLFSRFRLAFVMIQNDLSLVRFEFPAAIVDPSDGDISFEEATLPVTFRVLYDGAGCLPLRVKYLGQARKCLHPGGSLNFVSP